MWVSGLVNLLKSELGHIVIENRSSVLEFTLARLTNSEANQ